MAQVYAEALAGDVDAPLTVTAIKPGAPPLTRRGPLASMWAWVKEREQSGYGIYATVNQTDGERRTKGDITRLRAVWIDNDQRADTYRLEYPLAPHLIVESSPGKYHTYWFTDAAPDLTVEDVMRTMIGAEPGADAGVFDISRVLRLPGTVNQKPEAGGHVTRVVFHGDHARFTLDELVAAWPPRQTDATRQSSFNSTGAIATIAEGAPGVHDALRGLAALLSSRGVPREVAEPLLIGYASHHDDGSQRMRERIAEIPGLCASAEAKFLQPDAIDSADPIDLFATSHDHAFGFNATHYPPVVASLALDIAGRMGCDPLIPAWTAIAACAGLLPDRFTLRVKARDETWRESARLWVAFVGAPSSKKSPPMSAVLAPVERMQARMARQHEVRMAQWSDACAAARRDKRAELPAPAMPRVLVNDATTESLALVLHANSAGVLSVQDELSGWFGAHDAYRPSGTSKDRGFWLQAYNGAPYTVDRVKGAIFIEHLSVSIVGGIQPGPMRDIASKIGEDGLLQRFITLPVAPAQAGADVAADARVLEAWGALVEELASTREMFCDWCDRFTLSPTAQQVVDGARRRLDKLSRNPTIDRRLAAALAKAEGQLARLVLTFHLIENRDDIGLWPEAAVSWSTADRAARVLFDLLIPAQHDFYARVVGESERQQQARRVAGYILARELETVTDRDIYREALKELRDDERGRLDVMRSLELAGWVAPVKEMKGRTTQWTVNPRVHSKFAEQAVAEQVRRRQVVQSIRDSLK